MRAVSGRTQTVREVLTGLDGIGRAVVEAVHVLGPDATTTTTAAVLELDFGAAAAVLAQLVDEAHVRLDGERIELASTEIVPPTDRTRERLHRRAAVVLHDLGLPDDVVAGHLGQCGPVNAGWVVDMLRAEAQRHQRAGDQTAAIALLERALGERVDTVTRASLLLELAAAEARLNPIRGADRYRDALTILTDPVMRLKAAVRRSRSLVSAGLVTEALEQLDAARREIDDPLLELEADLAYVAIARQSLDTRPLGRARLARIAPIPSPTDGETSIQLLGELAYERALSGNDHGTVVSAAIASFGGDDLTRLHDLSPFTRHAAMLALCWSGELRAAERAARLVLARAERRGVVIDVAAAHEILCNVEWRRGEPARTIAHADQVIAAATDGFASLLPGAIGFKAMALAAQGNIREALETLELPGDDRQWSSLATYHGYLIGAAWTYVAAGDVRQAHRVALRCGTLATSMGTENPAVLSWREAAAHAAAAMGMHAEACDLALDAVERARAFGAAGPIAIALRALAAARDDDAIRLLGEAQTRAAETADRLLQAHVQLDLARVRARRGDRDEARRHAQTAVELAHEIGAAPLEAEAHIAGAALAAEPVASVPSSSFSAVGGHLRVLGGFSLIDGSGQQTTPSGLPGRAVRVLAAAGAPLHVEQLADCLWDDAISPDRTRARLRNVIARTRVGQRPAIQRDGDVVFLDPDIT
ncbi:MAG: hypothetical protein QOJ67_3787, partial [Acidimicrobiaceae bacterium]